MATSTANAMTLSQKVIAIAVTIIIISIVAIPVIQDVQEGNAVAENNTGESVRLASSNVTVSFSDGVHYLNNVALPSDLAVNTAVAYSDNLAIVINASGFVIYDYSIPGNWTTTNATISNGIYSSVDTSAVEHTGAVDGVLYGYSVTGNIGNFKQLSFNVDKDKEISGYIRATVWDPQQTILSIRGYFHGTVNDLHFEYAVDYTHSPRVNLDISKIAISLIDYELSEDGLSYIVNPGVSVTYTDPDGVVWAGSTGVTAIEYQLFAPIQYHILDSDGVNPLINVIPVILILVPLMMAVRMMALRRN